MEYIEVMPGDTLTLWAVLHNKSASASYLSFPIGYESPLEFLDMGFSVMSFDFLGLCVSVLDAWNFVPHHDPDNMYVTWMAWNSIYPVCDVPRGSQQDFGWVTFRIVGQGIAEIVEGVDQYGYGIEYCGGGPYYSAEFIEVSVVSGISVKEDRNVSREPRVNFLDPVEPNPFRDKMHISFGIAEDGHVDLRICDGVGRTVRSLVNDRRGAGTYTVTWDGRSDIGQGLPRGIYVVKLTTESFSSARKVVLR